MKKTWVSIVVAATIIAGLVVAAFVGAAYVFMRTHVHTEAVQRQAALAEFAEARARFQGQTPLIELASDGQPILRREPAGPRTPLGTLHALGYDRQEGRLSRVDLPGWFVRAISAGGRIRLANLGIAEEGGEAQRLTLVDLERHGPGLVLDVTQRGNRLLVWTE